MTIIPPFIRRRIAHRPNLLKIVDNIGWLFFDKILRMGVGLFVGVWIARYLGPEQFGQFSFAIAFVGLFGAFATLGLPGIVVRDIVRDPEGKEETLGTAAILQFFGGIIAYALIMTTIFWLRPEDALAKTLVAILGSTMLFKVSDVAVYWFESQVMSKYTVWVQNGAFLIFAVIKVVLILQNASLIAFAWATMAEALVVCFLMLGMLSLRGPRLRQLRVSSTRAKSLLSDSWPLLLSGIAVVIYMKIDQIMLGQMVGDEAVGIYGAAVRVSEVWYFVPMMIVASVFPTILEAKKRSEKLYYDRLQKLYDLMVWLAFGIALPMMFLSTPIVNLLYGETYLEAGRVLSIHAGSGIFVALGVAASRWVITENYTRNAVVRTTTGGVLNIALNFLLVPNFGPVGAAIATLISYFYVNYFSLFLWSKTRVCFYQQTYALNLFKNAKKIIPFH